MVHRMFWSLQYVEYSTINIVVSASRMSSPLQEAKDESECSTTDRKSLYAVIVDTALA